MEAGAKLLEIDPRGDPELVRGIGERPARIAQGVLRAVDAALAAPTRVR
jgi:xanthine dehydrogenase accessory factor